MRLQQKHNFSTGLNLDDDPRLLAEGEYLFAENVRTLSSEGAHAGVCEPMAGTLPAPLPAGFGGTLFVTTKSLEDRAGRRVFFWNADITPARPASQRRHAIFRYDTAAGQVSVVLSTAALNFSPERPVTHAAVIGDLLFWTDDFNPPRQINVATAGGKAYPLTGFHLSLGKQPPLSPLYVTARERASASVDGGGRLKQVVQLTYRYVYRDGQRSALAPYSLAQHGYSPLFDHITVRRLGAACGLTPDETAAGGGVDVLPLDSDRFADQVTHIEVFARESQYLPFKLMRRIRVADFRRAPETIRIDQGTTALAGLSAAEAAKLFDAVPLRSAALETADNRIFLACNVEDFPAVEDFDVEAVDTYANLNWHDYRLGDQADMAGFPPNIADPQLGQWLSFKAGGLYQVGVVFYDEMNRSSLVYTSEKLKIRFPHLADTNAQVLISRSSARVGFTNNPGPRPGIPTEGILVRFPSDGNGAFGYRDGNLDNYDPATGTFACKTAGTYNFTGNVSVFHNNGVRFDLHVNLFIDGGWRDRRVFKVDIGSNSNKHVNNFTFQDISLSAGQAVQIRVLRSNPRVSVTCDLNMTPRTFCEMTLVRALLAGKTPVYDCAVGFRFPESFRPPEWAVAYQVVRTDCLNYEFFLQGFTGRFYWYQTDPADENKRKRIESYAPADQDKASHMYIRVKAWYADTYANADKTKSNPPNEIFYTFQRGDRVALYVADARHEFDIIEVAEDSLVIKRPFPSSRLHIPQQASLFVEVFRERKLAADQPLVFHEAGEWYPVLNPKTEGRAWSKRDWTYVDNATVVRRQLPGGYTVNDRYPFTFGDTHVIRKTFYLEGTETPVNNDPNRPQFTQSMHPDHERIWDRWEHASGRPAVAYDAPPRQASKATQIRFSGRFVADSRINDTSRFDEGDQNLLPASHGRITALRNGHNDGLESQGALLLALADNEATAIYVGRRRLEDLSGQTSLVASDQVIGSYNTLKGGFGCAHPESVAESGGTVYYWCAQKGAAVRYGRDGLTAISEYKMRDFFNRRASLLRGAAYRAVGGFDPRHQQYLLSFAHPSVAAQRTAVFNERANRWEMFVDFAGVVPEAYGASELLLASFRGGVLHRHDGPPLVFYGQKADARVKVATNTAPSDVKVFQNISLEATDRWEVEAFSTPEGQQSRLLLSRWARKEDVFYAEIPRDLTTPRVEHPIVNGRVLRSTVLETMLRLDPSAGGKARLFAVNVYAAKSDLSNR